MGSGGRSKQTSSSKPWIGQQPYLKWLYSQGQQVSQDPRNFGLYSGSRVAPESQYTDEYHQAVAARVREGDPNLRAASAYNQDVLSSDWLERSNPHTSAALQGDLEDIRRQYMQGVNTVGSDYEASGRSGGGARRRSIGEAQRIYGQEAQKAFDRRSYADYQQRRGIQAQAAARAPGLTAAGYSELGQLGQVGQQQTAYDQRVLDDLVQKYEYYQRLPMERLSMQSQILGTSPVMTSHGKSKSLNVGILSCAAAAEIFGWWTQEWIDAARWINRIWPEREDEGREFLSWYRDHNKSLARTIRTSEKTRTAWEPFFRWARDMGAAWSPRAG